MLFKYNPLYLETKNKRLQLLMQPSLLNRIREQAAAKGSSVNDYIHELLLGFAASFRCCGRRQRSLYMRRQLLYPITFFPKPGKQFEVFTVALSHPEQPSS